MDEKQYWKKTDEIEIDLLDLLRGFLGQWKQIIVLALVGALLAGGYSYVKSKNAAAEISSVSDGSGDSSADDSVDGSKGEVALTEEEQQAVDSAVQLQIEMTALEDYLNNSVRMKIDPYHKDRVLLLYSLDGADRQVLFKAAECYVNFLSGGGLADAVKKEDKAFRDMDSIYLAELVSAWQQSNSNNLVLTDDQQKVEDTKLFYIEVTGENTKMAKQLSEDMNKALEDYIPQVKKICGDHKVKLLSSTSSVRIDNDLQTWQHDKREALNTSRTNLKTMTDAMTDQQKKLLNLKSAIETDEEPEQISEEEPVGRFSKKYLLIGLVAGIFLYACLYGCWYIFRRDIRTAGEFKSYYTIPLLGNVVTGSKQPVAGIKKILGFSGSKWTGTGQADKNQQTAQMLNRIRLVCEKQQIKKLCLAVEFPLDGKEKELIGQVSGQLQEWGIQTVTAENLSGDVSQWNKLEGEDAMVLFCRSGITTHQSIDHVMEIVSDNKIPAAGAVVLE